MFSNSAINLPPGAVTGFDFILGDSFLKNTYTSFDYGDWTPDNRTAGVPFVQLLATTNITAARAEFDSVRGKEVVDEIQTLAQPATGSGGALSIILDALRKVGLVRRQSFPVPVPVHRVVVVAHAQPRPGRLVHMQRVASKCMSQMTAFFGPVAMALLAGTFGIILMLLVVAVVVGIRTLIRRRSGRAGYEALDEESKDSDDVLFDADRSYNHHITTQYTSIANASLSP